MYGIHINEGKGDRMTIDEAILFCEKTADEMYQKVLFKTMEQNTFREIAEYLRELNAYKGKWHKYYKPKG